MFIVTFIIMVLWWFLHYLFS